MIEFLGSLEVARHCCALASVFVVSFIFSAPVTDPGLLVSFTLFSTRERDHPLIMFETIMWSAFLWISLRPSRNGSSLGDVDFAHAVVGLAHAVSRSSKSSLSVPGSAGAGDGREGQMTWLEQQVSHSLFHHTLLPCESNTSATQPHRKFACARSLS